MAIKGFTPAEAAVAKLAELHKVLVPHEGTITLNLGDVYTVLLTTIEVLSEYINEQNDGRA